MRKLKHINETDAASASHEETAPSKKRKKGWYIAAIIVCVGVFVVALTQLIPILSEYQSAGSEYDDLQHKFVQEVPAASSQQQADGAASPALKVDWEQLKIQNEDICGWIYLKDTVINYPVVRGDDNDYYLSHTVTGQKNSSGSIFMDYRNNSDFSDRNTVLYGHRMNVGTMFAKLLDYADAEFFAQHPYLELYTEQGNYRLNVFAAGEVSVKEDFTRIEFASDEEFTDFLQERIEGAAQTSGLVPEATDRIVTLSTCVRGNDAKRFAVYCVLEGM